MTTLVLADREALRAALDSGLIPAEVQAAPLQFEVDDDGQLLLDPQVEISRADRKRLREAGVEMRRRSLRAGRKLLCFAEALPSEPAPEPTPPLGEVLFLSEGDEGFLRISGELLRLGSEDQRLAFFEDERGVRRNLCRVAEPPYYAILRALDPDDPLRAFTPVRPGGRVWIELGASHPQATRLEGEPGQLVLIPGPARLDGIMAQSWLRIPDGPWVDLHTVTTIELPRATAWTPSKPSKRLAVELRLVRAPLKREADFWVVRERALEQLEQLVRTVPDEIVARLRVATVEQSDPLRGGSKTTVVLRARRSGKGPPALDLDAEAYLPAQQIPDLYLPVGMTVDPPLRPSRLRELLATETDRIVWLAPEGEEGRRGRSFVRESLPESAFVPLSDWVDYLIGAHQDALTPWVRSTMFDLDAYVALNVEWAEGEAPKPAKPKPRSEPRQRVSETPTIELPTTELNSLIEEQQAPAVVVDLEPVDLPRSAVEQRLAALEREFCELGTALDDPTRSGMWAELGNLQAALFRSREAGLCWSRALWERASEAGLSHLALARRWVESEAAMLGYRTPTQLLGIVDVVPSDLDEQMVRALAAEVVLLELERRAGPGLGSGALEGERLTTGLAALQRFFASHGTMLDLRTLWLGRSALARLAGDDRLALFQTRDLIMASLREGVGLARNVPSFVRTYGSDGDAVDLNLLADELVRTRDEYLATKRKRSTIESTHPEEQTHAYVRLVFAWGLARLGRPQVARDELKAATELLGGRLSERGDAIHRAAFASYDARIEQALEGLPPGAPFSAEPGGPIAMREALQGIDRFKYDRLVQLSRILAPRQDVDAFEKWSHKDDKPFAGLALLTEPEALSSLFERMLAELGPRAGGVLMDPELRARSLGELFEYLEALPEPLAVPHLRAALGFVAQVPLDARPRLLRNALLLAGYYDRPDLIDRTLAAIVASDAELSAQRPADYAELLTRCAPVLRRSNHEAQLADLLIKLEQRVADDHALSGVTARLHLAAGFAALGQPARIQPAFAAAHALLPELAGVPANYQILLREIAGALSRSTPGQAIAGARALLERLAGTTDSMSTNSHFCLAVIQLMEAVVLSLASEDLALSDWARRWVEEDEHLLHRRIHRDLSASHTRV
jgi:hypothetical protein